MTGTGDVSKILDGRRVAAEIRAEVAEETARLISKGIRPGLTVVLVGEDPASEVYVRSKTAAAREVGLSGETLRFPDTLPLEELLATIDRLNADEAVDAILVQLPLPAALSSPDTVARVVERIDPRKDVDGFHPMNVGRLWQRKPCPVPCTPSGVMELLSRERIEVRGRRAVIVGRSDIVGKPLAALLLAADSTVTLAHSKTRDLPDLCREADLLVAAIGRPAFVTGEFVKEGAAVVDVGINRLDRAEDVARLFPNDEAKAAAFARSGSVLVGDCDPRSVPERAGRYTPVPGGVGPLTIACLLKNTVAAARARRGA